MNRRTLVGAAAVGLPTLLILAIACGGGPSPTPPGAAEIQGTYRAHSGPNTLELRGSTWTLTSGPRVFSGKFVVAGDEIVFLLTGSNHPAYEDFCRTDLDVYTWSLDGMALVLRPLMTTATGRADGRQCNTVADQVFRNGPWTKQS